MYFPMKNILSYKYHIGEKSATLLMVLTALLWSLGGLLIKMVDSHPLAISGLRSAIATVFILLIIRKPHFTWSFPQIAGAISFSSTVIMFVLATKFTTAANAILLQYISQLLIISVLGMWLLKEKTRPLDVIAIAFIFGGLVLFFMDNLSAGGLMGNIFGLIAGISFGFVFIFARMQKEASPLEMILLGNILTAIIGVPFTFVQPPDTSGWIGILLLGVFQLGIPYILYSIAIKHITALEAVLTSTIEPILNPTWVFLVLGERPGTWAFIGGLIVIVTVIIRGILSNLWHPKHDGRNIP
jgi:drug/metabolite transporter (DMT)-like permease